MDIYQQFESSLTQHLNAHNKVVLGLSGGMDSRVLLHLLGRFQSDYPERNIIAVHIHHGLSSNADQWQTQCQRWSQKEGIAFDYRLVEVKSKAGESLEQVARHARYQALNDYIEPGDVLVTGQHLDDQTETFLLALKRGSGPKGLSSMAQSMPFGLGYILRPLLAVSRRDIERYAISEKLEWVEDESNQDTRFDRNFLRQEVIPSIKQRWPSFTSSVARSARLCAAQEQLLTELLQPELTKLCDELGGLSIVELAAYSQLKRDYLIRLWLEQHTQWLPSEIQLNKLWFEVACARDDANPELQLAQGSVRRFKQRLFWVSNHHDVSQWQGALTLDACLALPDALGTLSLSSLDKPISSVLSISRQNLPHSLQVIFEPEGLSAHPYGRVGSRKMKKLYQELGVPSWQRRRIPIVMHQDKVVAVAGLFVDKDYYGEDYQLLWDKPVAT
ncbi:tRNA lysidine(34) synthetase TilS [Vibrio hippocampi]|uniref:tRNA(Ile)-lysidine synthase n=1 Tax=Vibrio hippocampi TaxID=654686 RepID=A0ABM8ZEM3_9VIBR|nr:tRNA lysidine(34) synthetase TilS [Vibrio hippocampi]CAH0524960.1 tRNA(Ile)-lysidine synthase [Vibrio hippocampi]